MASKPRSSLAANLILAMSSTVMTLLLFGLLEGLLRILGIGQADGASRSKYQQVYLPVMEPAEPRDGTPVFATGDVRLPYQTIRQDKPENALRIFTFGGSATAGLGYSPNVTFARTSRDCSGANPWRMSRQRSSAVIQSSTATQ